MFRGKLIKAALTAPLIVYCMFAAWLAFGLIVDHNPNVTWILAMFSIPSSILAGHLSDPVSEAITGSANLYVDFALVFLFGLAQYALLMCCVYRLACAMLRPRGR